jgi:tRNA-2-methylthio-N6-dimethylallyladenosine synthase
MAEIFAVKKNSYKIVTFGCQMNLADSGTLAAVLDARGYQSVESEDEAEIIILNTCSVREKAEERVYGRLGELKRLKNVNNEVKLVVVGCMAQRLGNILVDKMPHVDYVLGTDRLFDLPDVLESGPGISQIHTDFGHELSGDLVPVRDEQYSAFVTISRGCDNYCTYCIVPYVRGRERSLPAEIILEQVRKFEADGVREVTLLGQNVNSYLDDDCDFAALMTRVALETDISRIRFMTSHPKDLSERLISIMASEKKIMPHLHLPLQSGSDRILKRMNRVYDYEHYYSLVKKLRQAVSDISLTTDVIVGFPGETLEDYESTLNAVESIGFDSAFMFRYSVREGTAAADFEDDVPEEEKIRRLNGLIELQKKVSFQKNQSEVGKVRLVLVDGFSRRDANILKGKTGGNKTLLFSGDPDIIGSIRNVRVTSADSWTLHGDLE